MPTYEQQAAKMRRANILFMIGLGAAILLTFFALLGFAMWQGAKARHNTDTIIANSERLQNETSHQTLENRKRGDAILCIIATPVTIRTVEVTENCIKRYGLDLDELRGTK